MASSRRLLLLSSLFSLLCLCSAQPRPRAVVFPVAKDISTLQYVATIRQRTPLVPLKLVLDLGGRFQWVDCDHYASSSYRPARCRTTQCSAAGFNICGDCYLRRGPGCNNDTCRVYPENTAAGSFTIGELAMDAASFSSTDGSNPGPPAYVPRFLFACSPSFLLGGLAGGTMGMAGLGRNLLALPSQLAAAFSLRRRFALCLSSSTSANGVAFVGDGPYVLLPGVDASALLISYTPLLVKSASAALTSVSGEPSAEYFIGVTAIRVNEKPVPLNATLLDINPTDGVGGTKLSTVSPYAVLQRSIYRAVGDAFARELGARRVAPVAPFGYCFDSSGVARTRLGAAVPPIDLVLRGGGSWRLWGANSVVAVGGTRNNVLCLAFVDGGEAPRASVVVGGFQMEDTLLQFDLAASRLGFTPNLNFRRTTCANFNFTFTDK